MTYLKSRYFLLKTTVIKCVVFWVGALKYWSWNGGEDWSGGMSHLLLRVMLDTGCWILDELVLL
jgi:hypothetical protein